MQVRSSILRRASTLPLNTSCISLFQHIPEPAPPTTEQGLGYLLREFSPHWRPLHTNPHTIQETIMSLPKSPTTTAATFTAPILHFHTCPDGSLCGHYPDDQPATAASTHALNNTTRVLRLSLLAFIALRLFARRASIGALIGLCLIVGGFLYDIGLGLPGANAATAKTTTDSIASSPKTNILESAVEYASTWPIPWPTSAALAVLILALITTGHLHAYLPGSSSPTTNGRIITTTNSSELPPTRRNLPTKITVLLLIAVLISTAFAVDPDPELPNIKRSAAQRCGDISPIWITYYSTTTTWLPAVTVTAPPVWGVLSTPTGSADVTAAGTDVLSVPRSGSVCTEVDQAVCPIVEGRKTGMPPRVVAAG